MDTALECYYTMRELVLRHPGGRSGEASLAALRKLCRLAERSAADPGCAAALAAVERHAAELFAGHGGGNWARRQLLRELEEFRARLAAVEAARRPGAARASGPRLSPPGPSCVPAPATARAR